MKKPLVSTVYAIRKGRMWLTGEHRWSTFARAWFFNERSYAVTDHRIVGGEIVACRVRPLSTRTKAAPKRTR